MDIQVQYALEVMEGLAATVEQGVYRLISYTPLNPLALDATAQRLLEQAAGTSLDVIKNDLGETVGYCAKGMAQAGNGASTEVSTQVSVITKQVTVDAEMAAQEWKDIATGETATLSIGQTVTTVLASAANGAAGILALPVPAAGVAVGCALGIVSGILLYNIAPEFWTDVADELMEAGELIGGKVKAVVNNAKQTSFKDKVIEIYKNAFLRAGLLDGNMFFPETKTAAERHVDYHEKGSQTSYAYDLAEDKYEYLRQHISKIPVCAGNTTSEILQPAKIAGCGTANPPEVTQPAKYGIGAHWHNTTDNSYVVAAAAVLEEGTGNENNTFVVYPDGQIGGSTKKADIVTRTPFAKTLEIASSTLHTLGTDPVLQAYNAAMGLTLNDYTDLDIERDAAALFVLLYNMREQESALQPDAVPATSEPFEDTYPDWQPSQTIQDDDYYPISMPTDQNTQQPSQTGDNDKDEQEDIIGSLLFDPNPIPNPKPQPDPDPEPEPEPEIDPETPTPVPDPTDPNPEPDPSDPSPTLPIISGIHATKMCTIYNPTDGEVDDLGAFLWVDNVIEQIRLIFQDPMDGIISLHKIYAPPVTGTRKDIILGYIDSGVDALEVTNQFTTVNCKSVTIDEKYNNVTDYPPYTQAHIYLPFIGIEEIDVSEIMGGTVRVQYRVDAYTGTCVAQIFVTRSPDMSTEQMLYTFSGNASQTIPLTSANFTGLVSSLVSIAGGAATAGAGGALLAAGRGLTSHMASVSHSGSISANAGIMGPRVPYIILTRPQGYDANGYNSIYGYPANTTRYLSNCSGYVRVKDVLYRGDGTEEEKAEIVSLLKNGIIV